MFWDADLVPGLLVNFTKLKLEPRDDRHPKQVRKNEFPEAFCGGILAEEMGLGKVLLCSSTLLLISPLDSGVIGIGSLPSSTEIEWYNFE
jgi:hypothetical protein